MLGLELLGLVLAEEVADRLGGRLPNELGVVRVDDDLVDDRDDVLVDAVRPQVLLQLVLEHVADLTLGHRADDVERLGRDLVLAGLLLHAQVARLRTVAVRDGQPVVAALNSLTILASCSAVTIAVRDLLVARTVLVSLLDGVAAESYKNLTYRVLRLSVRVSGDRLEQLDHDALLQVVAVLGLCGHDALRVRA